MLKVLITGASGFVGQHLIAQLKGKANIYGLTNSFTPSPSKNTIYINCDIKNKTSLSDIIRLKKPDVIIHLAAIAQTWNKNDNDFLDINFKGTLNLYSAVFENTTNNFNPKILYISSSDIYGKTLNPKNVHEEASFHPVNFYGLSKIAADRLSYLYSQTKKLNIVILRPFPHTGPGQKKGFFVPDMISQIVALEKNPQAKNIIKIGNLDAIRDYTDVRDVVKVYEYFIFNDFIPGDTFNICSGKGIKIKSLLDQIIKLTSIKITLMEDPTKLRPSNFPILIGNNKKLASQTLWKPTISIQQTLQDTYQFWRNASN